jgi:polysaccharide biosynthesis/export protein
MFGRRGAFYAAALSLLLGLLAPILAFGQGLSPNLQNLSPELIEQLNRANGNLPLDSSQSIPAPLDQVRGGQRTAPSGGAAPEGAPPSLPSQLELDYSRRAGTPLTQYGYDIFRTIVPSTGELQNGAIADNYRLSIGDELVVTLRGQVSRSIRTRIDREGHFVIPDLPPIPAAGRTFADFRQDLERQVAATFLNTQVFVSVGSVRQISVAVLGEVTAPGIYRLGGFGSALDALALAGGVKKTGSLRRIMIARGGQVLMLDLYDVMGGASGQPDLSLADGDRIVIPLIGPTVAISGDVTRPGIYELPRSGVVEGSQITAFSGAPLRPTGNRFVKLAPAARGQDETTETGSIAQVSLRAGDILMVLRQRDKEVGSVRLDGHVRVPGIRSLAAAPDVRSLIGSDDTFQDNPYLLLGALETTDTRTRARVLVPIDLEAVMSGRKIMPLKDGDTVIVLGVGDVNYLGSGDVQSVLLGQAPPSLTQQVVTRNPRSTPEQRSSVGAEGGQVQSEISGLQNALTQQKALTQTALVQNAAAPSALTQNTGLGAPGNGAAARTQAYDTQICRGLQALATVVATARPGRFANALISTGATTATTPPLQNNFLCPPIFDKYPELLPLLVEHAAALQGEVLIPGLLPVVPGTPLSSLVAVAGGLTRDVDLKRVEITHYAIDNAAGSSNVTRELVQLQPTDLARVAVSPGDVIRFNAVFIDREDGPIQVLGEFIRPGLYDIKRGERLSQVIARAGGLTEQAYPYGAVFTRESVKRRERENLTRAAEQLESGLTTALSHTNTADQQTLVTETQQLMSDIRGTQPVGRIVVEADPTVLQVRPQLDVLMEPGDTVYMPKRPSYVVVAGEVLNPTALAFRSGATPRDYLKQAGGFTQSADSDSVFIVFPNGESQPVKLSFWNFTSVQVPPGSSIIVPKDLRPFDLGTFLTSATQIFGQLAISAAALAVIHDTSTQ